MNHIKGLNHFPVKREICKGIMLDSNCLESFHDFLGTRQVLSIDHQIFRQQLSEMQGQNLTPFHSHGSCCLH